MDAPNIDELTRLFGRQPESVSEVGLGQYLPLAEWPRGEICLRAESVGRTATVYLCPDRSTLQVEVGSPEPIAKLSLDEVETVVENSTAGIAALVATTGHGIQMTLRLRPDIEIEIVRAETHPPDRHPVTAPMARS